MPLTCIKVIGVFVVGGGVRNALQCSAQAQSEQFHQPNISTSQTKTGQVKTGQVMTGQGNKYFGAEFF